MQIPETHPYGRHLIMRHPYSVHVLLTHKKYGLTPSDSDLIPWGRPGKPVS